MRLLLPFLTMACVWACGARMAARGASIETGSGLTDPFESTYRGYNPGFTFPEEIKPKERNLSSEPNFHTMTLVNGSARADAFVEAARQKEADGRYQEALEIYQKVIEEYPETMYRVSDYGVFVPITRYCQLRMLGFPRDALKHYRTKHDARAREAYELARQRNLLEGLAEIRDTMMCTSYGPPAMLTLGDTALDRGHFLEAIEYYRSVEEHFPDAGLRTAELQLKIAYCRKMLGDALPASEAAEGSSALSKADLDRFSRFVSRAKYTKPTVHRQQTSPPHVAADDYLPMLPTTDLLGIEAPVWEQPVFTKPMDAFVFTQPVVTENSIVYRHKNILYCRSILNGELRWKNDLGGRVLWQNLRERQYPQEDILVQDGMVFTPVYKVGSSLLALDEITGQLKWGYGPMLAGTRDEARMRFEAAPAGGPMTVYAGYVLENIDGDTHIDNEYGITAFESVTGRVKWRTPICRLRPGLFKAGMAERRRNRIRSFLSPPLYHQGTVYYCTNAGALAAIDALSGRIKWVMKYPYGWGRHPNYELRVHDTGRQFGRHGLMTRTGAMAYTHYPMFWYNQRPLLIGDALYITPVDAPHLYRVNRRTGKVAWRRKKGGDSRHRARGPSYFMGAVPSGELLIVHSPQGDARRGIPTVSVEALDPGTGKVVWTLGRLAETRAEPVLKYSYGGVGGVYGLGINDWPYWTTARPFLSSDNTLVVTTFSYRPWPWFNWMSNLAVVDLNQRKRLQTRHYLTQNLIDRAAWSIENCDNYRKRFEERPYKDKKIKDMIRGLKEMAEDTIPRNRYPDELLPFSRVTFDRFGCRFEARMSPVSVAMVYDRRKVKQALRPREDPAGLFALAELAVAEARLEEGAGLLEHCLAEMPSEDVDFRATVNQLLYKVHKRLARGGARSRQPEVELKHCLGMSQTVGTLADEIETLFAFADAAARKGDPANAAARLRRITRTYAAYEYPVSTVTLADAAAIRAAFGKVFSGFGDFGQHSLFGEEIAHVAAMLKRGLDLYLGELAPVAKTGTMRAGDLAVAKMLKLKQAHPDFAAELEQQARTVLSQEGPGEERLARLWEYPRTKAAQALLETLFRETEQQLARKDLSTADRASVRQRQWRLADAARVCSLQLPPDLQARLAPPARGRPRVPVKPAVKTRTTDLEEARGTSWLVLQRRGRRHVSPDSLFLGGRVKKKLDKKFVLYCINSATGTVTWKAREQRGETWFEEIRLRGKGDEPGFFDAFVYEDTVVVHGWYDVLAFRLNDGKLKWRYRVPFDFEIKHALMSGDLLVLAGESETVVLYLGTQDPRGEVAWQEKEDGNPYGAPHFDGDRLVAVRKMPFNLTVRYRSTGKLIGRLALPDLTLCENHPLLDGGPGAIPMARDGSRLVVSDGFYTILLDTARMKVIWKRLIDQNDPTRDAALRYELNGDYLAMLKKDFDVNAMYMLSSRTGDILWRTDPKVRDSARPFHSMFIRDGKLFGIEPHPAQGFYFVGLDCKTGRPLFERNEQAGYGGKPEVELDRELYGNVMVARIKDRQDFWLKAFHCSDGKLLHTVHVRAAGDFGTHGRASATVQNGRLALLGKNTLVIGVE